MTAGIEFDELDAISHAFEKLALEKIDDTTFEDNSEKLKKLTADATLLLSDTRIETSLINASKDYNKQVLAKIDLVRDNERKEYDEERLKIQALKNRLSDLERKYKTIRPDPALMTRVLQEYMRWKTAFESTVLETSKLEHECKLFRQRIFEIQQENIAKIEHSRMFYDFLKSALKIAVLETTANKSTLVIAPIEKEDKWALIDTNSASRDVIWKLLADRGTI